MKSFKCKCGKDVLLDDEQFGLISNMTWYCTNSGLVFHKRENGILSRTNLACFIIDVPNGLLPDHKDRNNHNNQKENLRVLNYSQNRMNSEVQKNNTSGFKGVSYLNSQRCENKPLRQERRKQRIAFPLTHRRRQKRRW